MATADPWCALLGACLAYRAPNREVLRGYLPYFAAMPSRSDARFYAHREPPDAGLRCPAGVPSPQCKRPCQTREDHGTPTGIAVRRRH